MSQKAARGTKRTCQGCGARFYDLDNSPIICPMCEAEFKLAPTAQPDEDQDTEEATPPLAAAAIPADVPEVDSDDDADELADIVTDDVDVDDDDTASEDDNTFIEDDEDPNASVAAIVPVKPGSEDG